MIIMDGKKCRDEILEECKKKIQENNLKLELDVILIGDNDASRVYIKNKFKACEQVGIKSVLHELDAKVSESEVMALIKRLNEDTEVSGIILQSPIPEHLDYKTCASTITPKKDIDGFTVENIAALYHNRECIIPCTAKAVIKLLEKYNIQVANKYIVIVGRGEIVGKPLSLALTNRDATVTLCHSKTENLASITRTADILVSAVGKEKLITKDMVKNGFVGIDVGITRGSDGKITGDFDYENIKYLASYITPVPGGVGPMTIAMIIDNIIESNR